MRSARRFRRRGTPPAAVGSRISARPGGRSTHAVPEVWHRLAKCGRRRGATFGTPSCCGHAGARPSDPRPTSLPLAIWRSPLNLTEAATDPRTRLTGRSRGRSTHPACHRRRIAARGSHVGAPHGLPGHRPPSTGIAGRCGGRGNPHPLWISRGAQARHRIGRPDDPAARRSPPPRPGGGLSLAVHIRAPGGVAEAWLGPLNHSCASGSTNAGPTSSPLNRIAGRIYSRPVDRASGRAFPSLPLRPPRGIDEGVLSQGGP